MLLVLSLTVFVAIALGGLVLLHGALVLPLRGSEDEEGWSPGRAGGWCAAFCGGGAALALGSIMLSESSRRWAQRFAEHAEPPALALLAWALVAGLLAVRGVAAGLGAGAGDEQMVSARWRAFGWGLPGLAMAAGAAWAHGTGLLAPLAGAGGAPGSVPALAAKWATSPHAWRIGGVIYMAMGAGMLPPLLRRPAHVAEAMRATAVAGVPCLLFVALVLGSSPSRAAYRHSVAGPALVALVCGVLMLALRVRWREVAAEGGSALEVDRCDAEPGGGRATP